MTKVLRGFMIQIELYGKPVPWAAPRVSGRRFYSPKHEDKKYAQWQIKAQYRDDPIHAPVFLESIFLMPIPAGTSSIKRRQMLSHIIHPMKKPDCTNMLKFYEDCLKQIVISDDDNVIGGVYWKKYSETPGVLLRIYNLNFERPMGLITNESDRRFSG